MQAREMTLTEAWQLCRTCEDSCRRMADVIGAVLTRAEGAYRLRPVTVDVGLPEVGPIVDPDPPCVPPGPCGMPLSTLADKAALLARRVNVLVDFTRGLRDQAPGLVIEFYTCVPGGPNTPRP
jgi:hypothetical protein